MYQRAFGLRERPFSLTPDPDFLFLSEGHQRALDHLLFGLMTGEGFIVITGDVGVGKTTVCRALLRRLSKEATIALVLNPLLTEKELIRGILEDFGVTVSTGTKKDHLDALDRFLLAEAKEGRQPVLIIDEAQDLTPSLLELVRLLSNLETEKHKLLQIVLIGQEELREKLLLPELRQLNQRITVRAEITSLSRQETWQYVNHRLAVAGSNGRVLVSSSALAAVWRSSKGVPRVINKLCDRAFLAASLRGSALVERQDVNRGKASVSDETAWPQRWWRKAAWTISTVTTGTRRELP